LQTRNDRKRVSQQLEKLMTRGREAVIQGLLALLLLTPALVFGAVHFSSLAVFLALSSALMILLFATKSPVRIRLDLPSIIFLGLILFTLFQITPLPGAVAKLLSPADFEVREGALRPLGVEGPSFMPLTLDTSFTIAELGKLFLYLAVYWACSLWTRRHGARYITNLIVATGVAAAAVFLVHRILLLDKIYGFYSPIHLSISSGRISAPLINENHMAGLLGICSAVAIGRALAEHDRAKRALLIGIAGLVGGSLALTFSRGGIAAFVSGQCLFVLLRVIHRLFGDKKDRSTQHLAWLPLGLAFSLGLGLFAAQDIIIGEFARGDTKKLELAFEGLPLIGRFWATGVGRGAFWVGFPLVSDLAARTTFTHAENAVVQLVADWGIPVGGLALIGMIAAVGRLLKNPPSKIEHAAALVAVVAFGLHNLVDFNLEVPGVAVLAAALLATLQASRREQAAKHHIPKAAMAALAACSVAAAVGVGLYVADKNVDTEERLYRRALAEKDPLPFTRDRLFGVLSRHPADWYFPFVVGVHGFYHESSNPLPWLARAIELNSVSASAHFYVGRTFLRSGNLDQAMLELRLAAKYNASFAFPSAELLVSFAPDFNALSKIAFEKQDQLLLWGALARVFSVRGIEAQAEAADKAVLELNPLDPRSLARHARRLASQGKEKQAIELAQKLAKNHEHGPASAELQADIYARLGMPGKAIAVLEKELAVSKGHPQLLTALAWNRQRAGDYKGSLEAAAMFKARATTTATRAAAALLEAELSLAEGRVQAALASYREAYALDPSNLSVLRRIADLAEKHGDKQRAIEALRKLTNADPSDKSIDLRLKALEEKDKNRGLLTP
jgi:hypothetical protein